jgi:transposase
MPVMIGVDPHKASHTAAALDEHGQLLDRQHVPATLDGYQRLHQWAARWPQRCWAVEGAHGIGRALAQRLVGDGEQVLDVPAKLAARVRVLSGRPRPQERPTRRGLGGGRCPQCSTATPGRPGGSGGGVAPADQATRGPGGRPHLDHQPATPAADGPGPRRSETQPHRQARCRPARPGCSNQRPGGHPLAAGDRARGRRAPTGAADRHRRGAHQGRVAQANTSLLQLFGVGPVPAARFLGEVGDVRRFPTKHHFAAHTGTAPLEASSGQVIRHRLSRSGDRKLNHALYMMAMVQVRRPSAGQAYYRRKLAEGKSPKEALRCLKRRLSDAVHRCLVTDQQRHAAGAPSA